MTVREKLAGILGHVDEAMLSLERSAGPGAAYARVVLHRASAELVELCQAAAGPLPESHGSRRTGGIQ